MIENTAGKFADDSSLFAAIRQHLFTAVVGDVLDKMGCLNQFLPPTIRPLHNDMIVLGRAMPVLEADIASSDNSQRTDTKPFGLMFQALDSLKANEVYVATGASPTYALWGELMSVRATHLGANGAILDGFCRDSAGILKLAFPTFCYGSYAQDQAPRGRVVDFGVPIAIGGVRINPGDIMFGDRDGVLVIPRETELEAVRLALEKVSTENKVRTAIEAGMSTQEAFRIYGVM